MSFKKYFHPWFWRDLWWDLRWGVHNLIKYRKIVWKMRSYENSSILLMLRFQLKDLRRDIKKGFEEETSKNNKVSDIDRAIELLTHKIEEDFIDRQGGLNTSKYPFEFIPSDKPGYSELKEYRTQNEIKQDRERVKAAIDQELEECKELFKILAEGKKGESGIYSWWT